MNVQPVSITPEIKLEIANVTMEHTLFPLTFPVLIIAPIIANNAKKIQEHAPNVIQKT